MLAVISSSSAKYPGSPEAQLGFWLFRRGQLLPSHIHRRRRIKERKRSPVSNLGISGFNVLLFIPITVTSPYQTLKVSDQMEQKLWQRESDFLSCLEMAAGGMTGFEMRSISVAPDSDCSKHGIEQNSLRYKVIIWKFLGAWYVSLNWLQSELLTEHELYVDPFRLWD